MAGPPLCMRVWGEGPGSNEVLYGTQTGRVGLVRVAADEPHYCWDMLNERKSDSLEFLSPHSF